MNTLELLAVSVMLLSAVAGCLLLVWAEKGSGWHLYRHGELAAKIEEKLLSMDTEAVTVMGLYIMIGPTVIISFFT